MSVRWRRLSSRCLNLLTLPPFHRFHQFEKICYSGPDHTIHRSPTRDQYPMTLPTTHQSALDLSIRAAVGTFLGILIGIINRVIITGVLRHTALAQLVGFGIGGLIAGAIQGLFMRHYTRSTLAWIGVSGLGWMIIGLPELWFADNTFSLWLCDRLTRRALVGLVSGGIVGILQALTLMPRSPTVRWWLLVTILVWVGLWMLPALIFDNYLLIGEGGCLN
jgi:hypothetical protein